MAINHRVRQVNLFGRMSQNIKKSEKGGFTMKKFKLFLAAMLLMLLGCTNENSDGNGNKGGSNDNFENCLIDYGQMGELQDREGRIVTEENLEEFLEMFADEMDFFLQGSQRSQRSVFYGNVSGYRVHNREDNANGLETTRTTTYYDFSRLGRLYIGGRSVTWTKFEDNPPVIDGRRLRFRRTENIRLRFTGEFSGQIVYCGVAFNVYECINASNDLRVLISGSVKVNGIDITGRVIRLGGGC